MVVVVPSHFPEWPDGDLRISLPSGPNTNFKFLGWATEYTKGPQAPNKKGERTRYKRCLGVWKCPEPGCTQLARPLQPRHARPASPPTCKVHSSTAMVHEPCSVTVTWVEAPAVQTLVHRGVHCHPQPPYRNYRLPAWARDELDSLVRANPSARPQQLSVGSEIIKAARDIHPSLHQDRVAYFTKDTRRGIKGSHGASLQQLSDWQRLSLEHERFIVSTSIELANSHICTMTKWQIDLLHQFSGPLQADAVEGFISIPDNASVVITSGFHETLQRHVPLVQTIVYGKTHGHYAAHFRALFKHLDCEIASSGKLPCNVVH